jgi:pimeloyl-ACP methyl ester carboxylesterase
MTHGATADHRMFDAQVAALSPDYHVIVYDVRGHSASRPLNAPFTLRDCGADLIALLDALRIECAVLVGHSMGGMISQYAYLQAPERILAMAMIGSICIAFPYKAWEVLALRLTMPLFDMFPYERFKRLIAHSNGRQPATQEYMLRTVNQLSRPEFLRIWKAVTLGIDARGLPGHHIRVPLLIAHGDQDTQGTIRRDAPKWAAYEPQTEYVVIPDAGHIANMDNADFTNEMLRAFLRRHVGEPEERAT